jgi:hypothetical protein
MAHDIGLNEWLQRVCIMTIPGIEEPLYDQLVRRRFRAHRTSSMLGMTSTT